MYFADAVVQSHPRLHIVMITITEIVLDLQIAKGKARGLQSTSLNLFQIRLKLCKNGFLFEVLTQHRFRFSDK